jgi:MFS family permease
MVGNLIEAYDFVIYGLAAGLVFGNVFFPALGSAAGTVASLATYGVAFLARPFGSVIFGHFGDRLGRKKTLIVTLLIMGFATMAIGLIPPASAIGILAPIILILLRVIQGLAVGGEWAGAVLFVAESVPASKRGFFAIFPQLGGTLPLPLASLTFLLVGLSMSDESFQSWGWRIPFVASALLVGVGLWIRLKVEETPVFKKQHVTTGEAKVPFIEAFKSQPRVILVAAGVTLTTFAFVSGASTYLNSYGTTTLQLSRNSVLLAGVAGGVLYSIGVVVGCLLSDRIGRRRVIGGAHIAGIIWALALFPILNLATVGTFLLAICVTFTIAGVVFGPVGAFLPELFHTRFRYTATGFSYNLSAVIGGGIAPILGPIIISAYGSFAYGIFLAILCLIAALCTFSLRETRNTDLTKV